MAGAVKNLHTQPEDVDVFVRERPGHPAPDYLIGTTGVAAGVVVKSRNEAISKALEFARNAHVQAWIDRSEDEPLLLGSFRDSERETRSQTPRGASERRQTEKDRRPRKDADHG
jgi:hypothetical protein